MYALKVIYGEILVNDLIISWIFVDFVLTILSTLLIPKNRQLKPKLMDTVLYLIRTYLILREFLSTTIIWNSFHKISHLYSNPIFGKWSAPIPFYEYKTYRYLPVLPLSIIWEII